MLKRADVVRALGLEPHVEGGMYRRVYESAVRLPTGERSASAIYYLLGAEECSRLHRVGRDELWCWHGGRPGEVARLGPHAGREDQVPRPEEHGKKSEAQEQLDTPAESLHRLPSSGARKSRGRSHRSTSSAASAAVRR